MSRRPPTGSHRSRQVSRGFLHRHFRDRRFSFNEKAGTRAALPCCIGECCLQLETRCKVFSTHHNHAYSEVLSLHPSHSNTMKIISVFQITHDSRVMVTNNNLVNSVSLQSKNNGKVTFSLNSDMELRHWMYALELAIDVHKKTVPKGVAPPTTVPVLCGHLLLLSHVPRSAPCGCSPTAEPSCPG